MTGPAPTPSQPPNWGPSSTQTRQDRQQGSSKLKPGIPLWQMIQGLKKTERDFLLQRMCGFLDTRGEVSQFKSTEKCHGCRYKGLGGKAVQSTEKEVPVLSGSPGRPELQLCPFYW